MPDQHVLDHAHARKMRSSWKVRATPERAISCASQAVMSCPSNTMLAPGSGL